jgi:hypothetical protein
MSEKDVKPCKKNEYQKFEKTSILMSIPKVEKRLDGCDSIQTLKALVM